MQKKVRQVDPLRYVTLISIAILIICGLFYFLQSTILNNQNVNNNPIDHQDDIDNHIIAQASIGSMGDILLHEPILKAYHDSSTNTYNFDEIFKFITPYVQKFDYAVINFEGTISDSIFTGYPCFKCPESIIDSAKLAGFNLFLTANNHSNDGGVSGFHRTTKVLSDKGVDFTGTRQNINDKNYLVKDINGIKLGIVNYTYGEIKDSDIASLNGIPCSSETSKLINVFDYTKLENFYKEQKDIIDNMKQEGAQFIIYYMHWGNEYQTKQSIIQTKIAQSLSDLGVDIIIGGHPHVIQPIDVLHSDISLKDTICLYSMGNAISNQLHDRMDLKTGHTEDGVLFGISLEKYSNGSVILSDVSILPTWTYKYIMNKKVIYQIVPLDQSVDFNKNFNLIYGHNAIDSAKRSYNRTMQLLSSGLQKSKDLINSISFQ